jgi:predicted nuclease of predicted toxin-antitoxin system
MKLLLDANLSWRLMSVLSEHFSGWKYRQKNSRENIIAIQIIYCRIGK